MDFQEPQELIKLTNLPMPPSSNHQYAARSFPGKHGKNYAGPKKEHFSMARICPTRELEKYTDKDIPAWKLITVNNIALHQARSMLRGWMMKGLYIRVETFAFFPYFDLFTKEGLPRKMDGTNRLKALHDCLAEMLEVDDCWFWDAEVRKRVTKRDTPWCAVRFFPQENLTLEQMKDRGQI